MEVEINTRMLRTPPLDKNEQDFSKHLLATPDLTALVVPAVTKLFDSIKDPKGCSDGVPLWSRLDFSTDEANVAGHLPALANTQSHNCKENQSEEKIVGLQKRIKEIQASRVS